LASRLPGERPLLETNGDILWTQQRSSGVRSERKELQILLLHQDTVTDSVLISYGSV